MYFIDMDGTKILVTNDSQGKRVYELFAMEWTTEPPTQEGWYLIDDGDFVKVVKESGGLFVKFCGEGGGQFMDDAGWIQSWLGPFPVQKPPKKEG